MSKLVPGGVGVVCRGPGDACGMVRVMLEWHEVTALGGVGPWGVPRVHAPTKKAKFLCFMLLDANPINSRRGELKFKKKQPSVAVTKKFLQFLGVMKKKHFKMGHVFFLENGPGNVQGIGRIACQVAGL